MTNSNICTAMVRRASSLGPAASSTAAACPITDSNASYADAVAGIDNLITVRIVSINDVYDLTQLPR